MSTRVIDWLGATSRVTRFFGGIYVHSNTCAWWARGAHRRRRMIDVEILWRSLHARAERIEEARVAWEVFLLQDGQDHWHCPCGSPIRELFRTLTVKVVLGDDNDGGDDDDATTKKTDRIL